jgi:hypothetical protein
MADSSGEVKALFQVVRRIVVNIVRDIRKIQDRIEAIFLITSSSDLMVMRPNLLG